MTRSASAEAPTEHKRLNVSKQGEIGPQLWKLKDIRSKHEACTEIMEKTQLKKAEHNCVRTLGKMVDAWDGQPFTVKGQP